MPAHALYYPEWGISDPLFLAEALLYWDRLGCIVPDPDFRPNPWHEDQEVLAVLQEANERFVTPLVPTREQKARTHERIQAFAEHTPPAWCRPENLTPRHRTIFSAYKFAPETVQLLADHGWIGQFPHPNALELQLIADAAADLVLGALADECSSSSMPPITDDAGSFSANCNLLLSEVGAERGITFKEGGVTRSAEGKSEHSLLLMKIPHLTLDPNRFGIEMLRRVLGAREDPEIDERRKVFQRKVDDYLEKMRLVEEPERLVMADEFRDALRADLELLKRELRRAGLGSILSKDGIAASIGTALKGMAPQIGIALGLVGELLNYRSKRRDAFEKHWSSWIFSLAAPRLSLW